MKTRLLVLVLLPGLVLLSTLGIHAIEYDSIFDSFWWTIVTFTTVGYGDFSPATVTGRLFGVLVLVMGVIINSVIISLVSNWYWRFQSARERGLKHIRASDHLLICSDDADFVHAILEENERAHVGGKAVIIFDGKDSPVAGTQWRRAPWVSGPGYDEQALARAGVRRATVAYLSYSSDSETVMTAMQIRAITGGRTRIMAVVAQHDHRSHLEDVGCDYVIHPHDIYVPLMVKASFSPVGPEWIRQVVLGARETPTIENHPIRSSEQGRQWGDVVHAAMHERGRPTLPLGIVDAKGKLHTNPLGDHRINGGDRVLNLVPPRQRARDHEITLSAIAPPHGRILVMSDKSEFIARVLRELEVAGVKSEVVVISEVEPFAQLSHTRENCRWVHASSHSDEGLTLANAATARLAFIDHGLDSHTLMAVLRLERISQNACFAVASYQQKGFEEQLRQVGCDFALNTGELIAPLLTQTASHFGVGALIEEIISQDPRSESLFVARLTDAWQAMTWNQAVRLLKAQHEVLPVALVRARTNKVDVCPTLDVPVHAGDQLLLLTLTGNGVHSELFETEAVQADRAAAELHARIASEGKRAAEELRRQAERGDAHAQCQLGELYAAGQAVPRNPAMAFRWHERAARQGHSRSLFKLGTFFYQGFGVAKDLRKARRCMQRAAERGDLRARKALEQMQVHRSNGRPLINHDLLEHFGPTEREVYLKCMVRMLLLGKDLGFYEQGYFKEAVQTTRNPQLIHEIEQAILFGEALEIPHTNAMSFLEQRLMLEDLVRVAAADRKISPQERSFLSEVGSVIGAPRELVDRELERAEELAHELRRAAH